MKRIILLFYLCLSLGTTIAQEREILTSDSVRLYVNVKGHGPTCLYIHGGPGSGSYWLEKTIGDSLEQHFQMVYLDQRGVGRSTSPRNGEFSMERMVQDFEEVRNALGVEKWIILGHSFGGILQMGYVTQKPEAIKGLIFINCTLSMKDSFGKSWLPKAIELAGEDTPKICFEDSVTLFQQMKAVIPTLHQKGNMWKLFFASEANEKKMNATYNHFTQWNSDFSQIAMEIPEYWTDFRPLTSKINQPVLFFYGTKDWAIGPKHYMNISFPRMILWKSDVGHMPFFENKKDVLKAIDSFIKEFHL